PFAVLKGILTGTSIALLFAMLSLLRVRKISPLAAIRAAYESQAGRDPWRLVVMIGILAFVWVFSFLQVGEWQGATAFTAAMLVSFLLLVGMGRLVMWLVKKFFPHRAGYLWRQSLANLYRPNNQTLILIVSLGLGTGLIATLALIQGLLLGQFNLTDNQDAPNLLVIDIQPTQLDSLVQEADRSRLDLIASTPVVTMRVSSMRGKSRSEWLADTARDMDRWVLDYEFRVSYRDSLLPSEEVIEGEWTPFTDADGITEPIPISVSKDFAEDDGKVGIGDEMVWDVQGLTLRTVVTSIRKIDYQRLQGAFAILFPNGVLEEAPQFYVLSLRANGPTRSAEFQRKVAKEYPTLSVLDLKMFLNTAEEILDKISFIIQFMALFSILTGLIVLAGSVVISRYQRMREAVLLRTLGASGRQILTINALEYLLLGFLATGTGV
ncbi:MAG: FtsX-like permease family protein, partial [Bacteroidota bacterium]